MIWILIGVIAILVIVIGIILNARNKAEDKMHYWAEKHDALELKYLDVLGGLKHLEGEVQKYKQLASKEIESPKGQLKKAPVRKVKK